MNTINDLKQAKETVWINGDLSSVEPMSEINGHKFVQVRAAQNRLMRFMPYIEKVFPETAPRKGIIESNLLMCPNFEKRIQSYNPDFKGRFLLKDDAHLPIAGSVKARGGIYEVLLHAERLAMKEGLLSNTDDYSILASDEFRDFFRKYTIQVGSTGNLGLSIGIMGAGFGFRVIVHMSSDAKEWKKNLLREKGVTVKEYSGDYSLAVSEGRKLSSPDPFSYFIDDENSENLFMGYSTAALRLKVQLFNAHIPVNQTHPLFVYLPCGVGGAPGGITFGLKQMFGDNVHCFFAEPVNAPCFTLGMASQKYSEMSISDVGITTPTIADGLAVGRASSLVCEMMKTLVSGAFTVSDEKMLEYMKDFHKDEDIFLEPSACAGFHGLFDLQQSSEFKDYLIKQNISEYMDNSTHIVWATGGGLVPDFVRNEYLL